MRYRSPIFPGSTIPLSIALVALLGFPPPPGAAFEVADTATPAASPAFEHPPSSPSIAAGVLPMGVEIVPPDQRDALPLPIGLSASFFHLSEDLDVKKLSLKSIKS